METEIRFREVQRFRQPWLWALLGAQAVVALVGYARGRTRGETVRRLAALAAVALVVRSARLYTEVRDDGLYVKFAPFHRRYREIEFSELEDLQATGYSPLRYGGWGIRWSPSGMAYTASGKSGVRFERADGGSVFVGSDRPDDLLAAVQDATGREV